MTKENLTAFVIKRPVRLGPILQLTASWFTTHCDPVLKTRN